MLFLQPQRKERQATPKKAQDVKVEDDEYAGSTDVDEPGLYKFTVTRGKKKMEKVFPKAYFWEVITRFAFGETCGKRCIWSAGTQLFVVAQWDDNYVLLFAC